MFDGQNIVVLVALYSILARGAQSNEIKRSIGNGTATTLSPRSGSTKSAYPC
jgi:hypothetical protein